MQTSIVQSFIRAVNMHDIVSLAECISEEHVFVDAYGQEVSGKRAVLDAWSAYFRMFPDYHIELNELFVNGPGVAIFGYAGATFAGKTADQAWRIPAAWKAVVADGHIERWHVYADTKLPFESMKTPRERTED